MTSQEDASCAGFPAPLRGRYQPLRLLGQGGMGAVYLAVDLGLERQVAVKLMVSSLTPEFRARFAREARCLAELKSPSLLEVYHFDAAADPPYLVTEYLDGEEIGKVEGLDPLPPMLEVAAGLEQAHQAGLLHRDIKPANILYTREGRAVLLDFGLAQDQDERGLTATGMVVGTPPFLAPEQLRLAGASARSDWYQWGVSLYLLLEGRLPFGRAIADKLLAGRSLPALRFHKVAVGSPVAALLRACLAEDPGGRPGCLEEIHELLAGAPPRPRVLARSLGGAGTEPQPGGDRRRAALLGGLALAGLALGGLVTWMVPGSVGTRAPAAPDGPAPTHPATPSGSPPAAAGTATLGADYGERLRQELDQFLEGSVDAAGQQVPAGQGDPVVPALLFHGVRLLDQLPVQRRFFEVLGPTGVVPPLSEAIRSSLDGYDDSLRELNLPPVFAPFLEAAPESLETSFPASLGALEPRFLKGLVGRALEAHHARAVGYARAALEERRQLEEQIERGQVPLPPAYLGQVMAGKASDRLTSYVRLTRMIASQRADLEPFLARGGLLTRRFLVAAVRALEVEWTRPLDDVYIQVNQRLRPFLMGAMISASPTRLMGPIPRRLEAAFFWTRVYDSLQWGRRSALVSAPIGAEEEAGPWEDVLDRFLAQGDRTRAAEAWRNLLSGLRWNGATARFLGRYRRHHQDLLPQLGSRDQEEVLRDLAGLPEAP